MKKGWGICFWLLAASAAMAQEPLVPAVRVRVESPDRQMGELLALFRGSRATDPASALARWKRGSAEPGRLGKPAEALIAAFNPRMVDEWKSLDAAEVLVWLDRETGNPTWAAILPDDDGTFAALAPTFALSGGASMEPMAGREVDRLGGPGAPLMTRTDRALILAGDRDALRKGGEWPFAARRPPAEGPGGWRVEVEPSALAVSRSPWARRLAEVLRSSKPPVLCDVALRDRSLRATAELRGAIGLSPSAVDPAWLDWTPSGRALAAFSVGLDPRPACWDAFFAMIDRVERADPARANVAPARLRIGLLLRSSGIRMEADVLSHLRGVSGWVGSDGLKVDSAVVALHLDEEDAAARLLAAILKAPGVKPPRPSAGPGEAREIAQVDGRAVRVTRWDRSVVLAWGDRALEATAEARVDPSRSAGPAFRDGRDAAAPRAFVGGVWPGRVPGVCPPGTPLAEALAGARPIRVSGRWADPSDFKLTVDWDELDATVRRFLDLIPLADLNR